MGLPKKRDNKKKKRSLKSTNYFNIKFSKFDFKMHKSLNKLLYTYTHRSALDKVNCVCFCDWNDAIELRGYLFICFTLFSISLNNILFNSEVKKKKTIAFKVNIILAERCYWQCFHTYRQIYAHKMDRLQAKFSLMLRIYFFLDLFSILILFSMVFFVSMSLVHKSGKFYEILELLWLILSIGWFFVFYFLVGLCVVELLFLLP